MTKALEQRVIAAIDAALDLPARPRETTGERTAFLIAQANAVAAMLGAKGNAWQGMLASFNDENRTSQWTAATGCLRGMKAAIEGGLLTSIESYVLGEAYGDLLEQAKELFAKGYCLPAGVLGRAVLESHLRKWCEHAKCSPAKDRPTISDYTQALYKAQTITLTDMKHLDAMAAVGNNAAHAKDELKQHDVGRLLDDLTAFLANHPLP